MADRCPDSIFIGKAVLPSHRWFISPRGYANVIPSGPESSVYGIVYSLSDSDESWLDMLEGVGSGCYDKLYMDVRLYVDGDTAGEYEDSRRTRRVVNCLVYVDPRTNVGPPRQEYIDRINKGLKDAMLPEWWVEEVIRPFIPATSDGRAKRMRARIEALEAIELKAS